MNEFEGPTPGDWAVIKPIYLKVKASQLVKEAGHRSPKLRLRGSHGLSQPAWEASPGAKGHMPSAHRFSNASASRPGADEPSRPPLSLRCAFFRIYEKRLAIYPDTPQTLASLCREWNETPPFSRSQMADFV